jgi:hypothetical protein
MKSIKDTLSILKECAESVLTPEEYQQYLKDIRDIPSDNESYYANFSKEKCLVEAFFEHQRTLPMERRSNYFMISCPCPRCSPGRM